jgi:transposase
MGMLNKDDGWRLPDEMWSQLEPLLPPTQESSGRRTCSRVGSALPCTCAHPTALPCSRSFAASPTQHQALSDLPGKSLHTSCKNLEPVRNAKLRK